MVLACANARELPGWHDYKGIDRVFLVVANVLLRGSGSLQEGVVTRALLGCFWWLKMCC